MLARKRLIYKDDIYIGFTDAVGKFHVESLVHRKDDDKIVYLFAVNDPTIPPLVVPGSKPDTVVNMEFEFVLADVESLTGDLIKNGKVMHTVSVLDQWYNEF